MTLQKSKKASRGRTPSGQPNPIDIHVGNRIRLRRTILGWSQEKLAAMLGLTFQQVQKYERGSNRVGASRLWDIGNVLNVPINFFFEDMDKEVASQSPRVFSSSNEAEQSLYLEETSSDIDMDPMKRQETLELVKAYYKINNRKTAKILFDLIVAMSKSSSLQKHTLDED
ncbi:MAG: helix-turn-helix domain-containing protein [Azospirillum sp.]|nr:helix-turn-helix domain-containing protein [Azospirillum sp.]